VSRVLSWAFIAASILTFAALLVAVGAGDGFAAGLVDVALTPGFALPEAYWGGIHGEQVLLALVLNVLFYTLLFSTVFFAARAAWRGRAESS
jgi:hypothetical protein